MFSFRTRLSAEEKSRLEAEQVSLKLQSLAEEATTEAERLRKEAEDARKVRRKEF